jgi:hypothetical protein
MQNPLRHKRFSIMQETQGRQGESGFIPQPIEGEPPELPGVVETVVAGVGPEHKQ